MVAALSVENPIVYDRADATADDSEEEEEEEENEMEEDDAGYGEALAHSDNGDEQAQH